MLKLFFSLERYNSNFKSGENLLLFDVDECLYSMLWSVYLSRNFPNI